MTDIPNHNPIIGMGHWPRKTYTCRVCGKPGVGPKNTKACSACHPEWVRRRNAERKGKR